jgi:methyl-accepting chemotaxis protein
MIVLSSLVGSSRTRTVYRVHCMKFRLSISHRLYAIIGLCFCGVAGLAAMQANNLASSLREQRQAGLKHLAEVALSIAREEHESAVRDGVLDTAARQKAAARGA